MKLSNILSLFVLVPMIFGGLLWFDLRSIPLVGGIGYDISSELKKISIEYAGSSRSIGDIDPVTQEESITKDESSEEQTLTEVEKQDIEETQDSVESPLPKEIESADTKEIEKNDYNGKNPYNI